MKFRELLKKFRMRPVELGEWPVDNVDAIASADPLFTTPDPGVAPMAPPNWVPSRQDDRPRH